MNYTINVYQVLLNAKRDFKGGAYTGLCCCIRFCIENAITAKYGIDLLVKGLFDINSIIPEYSFYNPNFNIDYSHHEDYGFWWDESDKESRIKALNYLISCYEDKKDYEANVNHIIYL